jgi:hypothetical protein
MILIFKQQDPGHVIMNQILQSLKQGIDHCIQIQCLREGLADRGQSLRQLALIVLRFAQCQQVAVGFL